MIRKGILTFAATAVLLITSIGVASADGDSKLEHGAQPQRIQAQMGQQQSTFTAISNALNVKN